MTNFQGKVRVTGYAIKRQSDGMMRGRVIKGNSDAWGLYKTKKGAEKRAINRFGEKWDVVAVTLTIEETNP